MSEAKWMSAEEAVRVIKSGDRVFLHGSAATPLALIRAMSARAAELRGVEIVSMHTEGPAPYAEPGMEESFRANALFVGGNIRQAVQEGRADYIPVFLSEVPLLFRRGILPIDVALVSVSPPDRHGFVSLGTSVDVARAAVETAKCVIAQVNPNMPRTHGEGMIPVRELDALVYVDEPLPEHPPAPLGPVETAIGNHVASLVEDGATLQLGIGAIPDATLAALRNHKRLGIHSEMISDGVIDLVESGVITNSEKKIRPGKIVVGFINGSRRLYDFVDDNLILSMAEMSFVNDGAIIRQNPKVTAINSAIEVDYTGQVVADSIGEKHYSGIGGQMDFMRGASRRAASRSSRSPR